MIETITKYIFLNIRLDFFNKWIEHGVPVVHWLSGFFYPLSFLTAVSQNYARKYKIPFDSLTFDFDVTDKPLVKFPKNGAYCRVNKRTTIIID